VLLLLAFLAMSISGWAQAIPQATTSIANVITSNSATLNATVNPEGLQTTVVFEYSTPTDNGLAYGLTSTSMVIPAGTSNVSVAIPITGLLGDTVYHFQVLATNSQGSNTLTAAQDRQFTTYPAPVFGTPAQPVLSALGALVAYPVSGNGEPTSVYVQFGTTTSYGSTTPAVSIGSNARLTTVYGSLAPLLANTLYHYQLVTTSTRGGTNFSPDQTFTTLAIQTAPPVNAYQGSAAVGTTGGFFNDFGPPAINQNNEVAFYSTVAGGPDGKPLGNNPPGIWTDSSSGTLTLVAEVATTPVPGVTGAKFLSFTNPVLNDAGAVAFTGVMQPKGVLVTNSNNSGIWSTSSGTLSLVAREGSSAPGTSISSGPFATFDFLPSVGITDVNTVFLGTLNINAAAGVTSSNNQGIWEGTTGGTTGVNGDVTLRVRTGDDVGSKTILRFNLFPTAPIPPIQTKSFASNTGDLVLGAQFTDKTTGIITVTGGTPSTISLIADSDDSGNPAPGTGGATFASFGTPTINTADNIAFQALLNVKGSGASGIWAGPAGSLQLIARSGQIAPQTSPSQTFTTLSDPAMDNNGDVAFRGITTGPSKSNAGIWATNAGSLVLVAQSGEQAPGCAPGAVFQSFTSWGLADTGQVVFTATIAPSSTAGITFNNNAGLWAIDQNGALQLIVQTGNIIDGKTIDGISFVFGNDLLSQQTFGQTRGFSQVTGNISYLVTFTDKTTGIYTVSF
jgi:hypothetical protein